jgi:hypothetical protein
MAQPRADEAFVGIATAAEILGVARPNAAKMLARYGVQPAGEIRRGPTQRADRIYARAEVEALRDRRAGDVAAREADARRSATARAKTGDDGAG